MADKVIDINRKRQRVKTNTAQQSSRHTGGQNTKRKSVKSAGKSTGQDLSLYLIIFVLLAFGLVMLYSASSYEAAIDFGDSWHYLKRQLVSNIIGLVVMFGVSKIRYTRWRQHALLVNIVALFLVILVVFMGTEVNGAKRWLSFGGFSFQPAEISKIAVIVMTANILCNMSEEEIKDWKRCWIAIVPCLVQGLAILICNNNMSTAFIVCVIGGGMYLIARRSLKLYIGIIAAFIAFIVGYLYIVTHPDQFSLITSLFGFRSNRVLAWIDPTKYADGIGFQTIQGLYGIGSGGLFGKGLGESMQKLGYIPEAQNDMIFSIICEELGIFGAFAIIFLFLTLCWRFMDVAVDAKDLYGSLVASGVMIHIAAQVVLNIGVVTNTFPNTGVTLPFISYGGTSVVILLAEVGIVMSIAAGRR